MATAHLIPKDGLTVRDPRTRQPLPAEGAEVELGAYWMRRLADGDVRHADTRKPSATKQSVTIISRWP